MLWVHAKGTRETWGPYADSRWSNILTFARIGSRGRDREVWWGRKKPEKLQRVYRKGVRVYPRAMKTAQREAERSFFSIATRAEPPWGKRTALAGLLGEGWQTRWSDFVRGEWWIHDDGDDDYADADVGDVGHDQIALNRLLDGEALADALIAAHPDKEEEINEYLGDGNTVELYFQFGDLITDEIGALACGGGEKGTTIWHDIVAEGPAFTYMKHRSGIRVINLNFQLYGLDQKALRNIQGFVESQSEGQEVDDNKTDLCIEDFKKGEHNCVPVKDFLTMKYPKQFWTHIS